MFRLNAPLAWFLVVPASFLACLSGGLKGPETALHSQSASAEPSPSSLVLELDRAILVLKRGLKEGWATRDQYLTAFEKTPNTDPAGRPVTVAKQYVECEIGSHLRIHQVWDECPPNKCPPIEIEVHQAIIEFTRLRIEAEEAKAVKTDFSNSEGQVADLQLPPCGLSVPRRVAISAGVATSMLKTKIDPVYPPEAFSNHVSGTVVLMAVISTEGLVRSLKVISGPVPLQKSALNAVRQWTYRPYLLNNVPVEVETTVNIVFTPSR